MADAVPPARGMLDSSDDELEEDDIKSEVQQYLDEKFEVPDLQCMQPKYLLTYWKEKEKEWPNLCRMARQFLGAPASSAGVERLFSKCGRMPA